MQPITPKLDALAAWNDAARRVSANRGLLMTVAGVFLLLPTLVLELAVPQPTFDETMTSEQMWPLLRDYYIASLPWALPTMLLGLVGVLALQIVMGDRTRPTVGQAIRRAFALLPVLIAAQLLYGLALGLGLGLLLGIGGATGSQAIAAVFVFIALGIAVWLAMRFIVLTSLLAMEPLRNPVALLKRCWALTRGQAGRIALFLLLLALVYGIVSGLIEGLVGTILAFVANDEVARVLIATLSSTLSALGMLYLSAVQLAIYRQLAGPAEPATTEVFS